jgi:hypothetical protein
MLKYFFDWHCVVHYGFIPECTMANKETYLEVLSHMQEADFLNNSEYCMLVQCCLLAGACPYAAGRFSEEF